MHKKIDVLEYQNEQQQEELKRLQQKGKTHYLWLNYTQSYSALICTCVDIGEARLAAVCNKEQQRLQQHQGMISARDVQNSQLQKENKLAQDKCK